MPSSGWKALLDGAPWLNENGAYPIVAYSEFMPAPHIGRKPYRHARHEPLPFVDKDLSGWCISEYEEALELRPGLNQVGRQLIEALVRLAHGHPGHGVAPKKLIGNPYWPQRLVDKIGSLKHERFVFLSPLALSRTQDDKGRIRWTLFGGSEHGPERAFWKSFHTAPNRETPESTGIDFIRKLLADVYGVEVHNAAQLRERGFRILSSDKSDPFPPIPDEPLPSWTARYLWRPRQSADGVKYLLTFRPFDKLPEAFQTAYLKGRLHLLPYPGSLVFWGAPGAVQMQADLPLATQFALQNVIERHEAPWGLRVPQGGWLHEPRPGHEEPHPHFGAMRNTFVRTHRWGKVLRDQDELALLNREDKGAADKVVNVLFSTVPDDLGLYDKPMARNAQLWTHDFQVLLNGPFASGAEMKAALHAVQQGGVFGYRFVYPPMHVGRHSVYWHRPLVAWMSQAGAPVVMPDGPTGYLTAYRDEPPQLDRAIELWPRFLNRELPSIIVKMLAPGQAVQAVHAARGLRKLFDAWVLSGEKPLSRSFAHSLLAAPKHQTLESWLEAVPGEAGGGEAGVQAAAAVQAILEPEATPLPRKRGARTLDSLTFDRTATRSFEVSYWKTIAYLAEGKYRNKNNADCVRDDATRKMLSHERRDLEALGDSILAHYAKVIAKAGMTGQALAGEMPFQWRTDFDFPWADGWLANQDGRTHERDLIAVIPGRDRKRAIILADHYDTAYMLDCFDPEYGGDGARVAAAGADDNHSATACLMLAAPILLDLSHKGLLGCDVWLVHLTGEEFPSDCLGARALCQRVIEGTLQLRLPNGKDRDLSRVEIGGVYVMDMIAHNNDRDRDVFQMSPGVGAPSLWLARHSQTAAEIWNASAPIWNQRPTRKGKARGRRSLTSGDVPEVAAHPTLLGQVRTPADPHSTLYNTDGLIFSDAGVPVVLFMENYDINRQGYHDTHDTMANIDLDYGAAVAAIAIESAARAASEKPPR